MHWQNEMIKKLNVKQKIEPEKEIRNRIDFLKDYFLNSGARGFVLEINGSQDSTLAGRLVQMAVEELRLEKYDATFIAVCLTDETTKDETEIQTAIDFIQPDKTVTINIENTVDEFVKVCRKGLKKKLSDSSKGNVKARFKMAAQYAIADESGFLVVGTHFASQFVTGFFTKYGDGAADVFPLADLTQRQGRQLLVALNAPRELYMPKTDLLDYHSQLPDEAKLGVTYEEIDDFLEGKAGNSTARDQIVLVYQLTQHKRELPATPNNKWWE